MRLQKNQFRKVFFFAEENSLKVIEAFVAGQPTAFSKVEVATMATNLKKGNRHKKKAFSSIQEELELTIKIVLARGTAPTSSLSMLQR